MGNPYDYFVGKPVTIVTLATSLRFTPDNHLSYHVGILRSVDEWTCTLVHPVTWCRSIFRLEHLVAMHEEQQVNPEDPEDLKLLQEQEGRREEYKKRNPNLFQAANSGGSGNGPVPVPAREPRPAVIPRASVTEQDVHFNLDDLQKLARLSKERKKGHSAPSGEDVN